MTILEHVLGVLAMLWCAGIVLVWTIIVSCARSGLPNQGEISVVRENICDMEGDELNAVGWHEEIEIIQGPREPRGEPCIKQ